MSKKFLLPVLSSLFVIACGTAKTDEAASLDSTLGTQYEKDDASADVEEAKFNALLDSYDEASFGLDGVVNTSSSVVVSSSPGAASGATGAAGPSIAQLDPAKLEEFKKRAEKIHADREMRELKQRERIPGEKERPKEREWPAFRIALQESRQYVLALVGIEKSPFENFRAALIDAKSKAKSEEEYKTLVEAASKVFIDEKVAAWKLVQEGLEKNKVEIEGIRAARKAVVAACVIQKEAKEPAKIDVSKLIADIKVAPTAAEIEARKMAKDLERKDESVDKDAKKAKAESAECLAATASLKKLITVK